jgi:hypothetical protein
LRLRCIRYYKLSPSLCHTYTRPGMLELIGRGQPTKDIIKEYFQRYYNFGSGLLIQKKIDSFVYYGG